jgi:AmiR/NasT family two-component response regulator
MKIAIATLILSLPFVPSSGKIDPKDLTYSSSTTRHIARMEEDMRNILTDAQSLRDIESVIINMPQGSTITPDAVIALIESHRKTNMEHYTKKDESGRTEIGKSIRDNQQILLDAQKAIKKTKTLEDEVERLRNKLEGRNSR